MVLALYRSVHIEKVWEKSLNGIQVCATSVTSCFKRLAEVITYQVRFPHLLPVRMGINLVSSTATQVCLIEALRVSLSFCLFTRVFHCGVGGCVTVMFLWRTSRGNKGFSDKWNSATRESCSTLILKCV